MKRKTLLILLQAGFIIRLATSLVKAFGLLQMPHIWRQTDTLGVSYRYWLRFSQEPFSWKSFLPAVLQSGDGNGIMPMEFPLLNLIFAPAFAFGPYWGKVIASVGLILLVFGLCWKLSRSRVWFAPGFLLLPTLSYSADYIDKFMPDVLAMLFVAWGSIRLVQKHRPAGLTWISLGLLMKPTVIVGLAILFAFGHFRRNFWKNALMLLIPIGLTALYYTAGMKFIDGFRVNTPNLFAVEFRSPLRSLIEVFSNFDFIFHQFRDRMFLSFGILLMLVSLRKTVLAGLALLTVQFSTIALLDGNHMAIHDYYLAGLAPMAVAVFFLILRRNRSWLKTLALVVVSAHALELSIQYLSPSRITVFFNDRSACQALKSRNPTFPWNRAQVFRSPAEPYPAFGLCFGEREGSAVSTYGFYGVDSVLPKGCKEIDREGPYCLVQCGAQPVQG